MLYCNVLYIYIYSVPSLHSCSYVFAGGPPDVGKMLGGEEDKKDPEAEKEKEEERQEALRQEEDERKAKHAKMEAERESLRQGIRDKVRETNRKLASRSSFTHPHIITNLYDFVSSAQHKSRHFEDVVNQTVLVLY